MGFLVRLSMVLRWEEVEGGKSIPQTLRSNANFDCEIVAMMIRIHGLLGLEEVISYPERDNIMLHPLSTSALELRITAPFLHLPPNPESA